MRRRVPLILLGLALSTIFLISAQGKDLDQEQYSNKELGLTIKRPQDSWRFQEEKTPAGAKLRLKLYSPKASCYLQVTASTSLGHATKLRDAWAKKLLPTTIGKPKKGQTRISSQESPWLEFSQRGQDQQLYKARYHFLTQDKACLTLGFISLAATFTKNKGLLKDMLSGISWTPKTLSPKEKRAKRLTQISARCGSQIKWAKSWEQGLERAKSEKKLIAVFFHDFKSYKIPNQWLNGPLANSDILHLLSERFVCLPMNAGTPASMRLSKNYGMSGSAFGSALLLFDSDASFIQETNLVQSDHVYRFCLKALESHPQATGAPLDQSSVLSLARSHLRRGEHASLQRVLAQEKSAQAAWLRAQSFRLQRQAIPASQALKEAWKLGKDSLTAELLLEQGKIQMGLGQLGPATRSLKTLCTRFPNHKSSPEALFWLGACYFKEKKEKEAVYAWEQLIRALPKNPWSAKAAANLLGLGALVRGRETLKWLSDKELDELEAPPATDSFEFEKAEKRALRYLLKSQRDSGDWLSPRSRIRGMGEEYNDAVTAIAALSLIPYKDQKEVQEALKGALAYFRGPGQAEKVERERSKGWYSNWRRAYTLRFLAEAVSAKLIDSKDLSSSIDTLIKVLSSQQRRSGGWPYAFIPGDPKESFDPSTSFTSAAILDAFMSAKSASFKVEERLLERGSAYLKRLRMKEGGYRYFEKSSSKGRLGEASGRAPYCTLILFRQGKVKLTELRSSLDLFLEHRGGLVKELRKEICHTGPQGQGSHYFFFDYRYAAAATRLLPQKMQGPYRKAILEDIAKARYGDGSFVSMPGLGRVYGSAMALMSLYDLRAKRRF